MDEQRGVQALAVCPLFADVNEADLRQLASAGSMRRYRRGQLLFSEGDPGDSMLVVVDGSLKAVSASAHGEELLLAVVDPPGVVGELTVADGGRRSATVTALTDASVLRLERDVVLAVAAGSPALTHALLGSLAEVVRRLTGAAADLVFLDTPRRVAKFLLSLEASESSTRIRSRLTQTEMAHRVGTSRQSLNAALQGFRRRGWITVAGQEIELRDPVALRHYVES
ncbi:Crp/Fnr family transcriptional regulator [Actinomycetospora sp. CA-084318]|uniref:Crp/Fnr family transcriptional regulator n=1 Tax=Actinomycetospora sp. CA-084318 TaxID=3239892 RepID=UPI003D9567AD